MEVDRDLKPEESPSPESSAPNREVRPGKTKPKSPKETLMPLHEMRRGAELMSDGSMGAAMTPKEYEKLLDLYDVSFKNLAEGEVVRGKVLKVLPNEVIVDVGYKSEGLIDIEEFTDSAGRVHVPEGTWSTFCSRRRRTRMATSSSPRKRPRR